MHTSGGTAPPIPREHPTSGHRWRANCERQVAGGLILNRIARILSRLPTFSVGPLREPKHIWDGSALVSFSVKMRAAEGGGRTYSS